MDITLKTLLTLNGKYTHIIESLIGIDDSESIHYNKIIDRDKIKSVDWKSSEILKRKDHVYKWFFRINHNIENIKGSGSFIFFHIWRNSQSPTLGCTAVSEKNIISLIKWIRPGTNIQYVLMTKKDYKNFYPSGDYPKI